MAVKMILQRQSYHYIQQFIHVSSSLISKWKNRILFEDIDSLKLHYTACIGYLLTQ